MSLLISISRKLAAEQGLTRFFTGKPCKNHHLSERYVSSGNCISCVHVKPIKNSKSYNAVAAPGPYVLPPGTIVTPYLTDRLHKKVLAAIPQFLAEIAEDPEHIDAAEEQKRTAEEAIKSLEKSAAEQEEREREEIKRRHQERLKYIEEQKQIAKQKQEEIDKINRRAAEIRELKARGEWPEKKSAASTPPSTESATEEMNWDT